MRTEAYAVPFPDYPPTVPEFLRTRVERFGERPLILLDDVRITYRDAALRSARLARGLIASGIGKGSRVALLAPNGPDWVVAWLAATRIGAIAIPINTFYQARELGWVLRHCDALILNTPGAERLYRSRYPEYAPKMTCIPNGFDRLNVAPPSGTRETFTIMHVGDFYRARTPERLLDALCSLNDPRIEFVHIGPSSNILERYADRLRIRHIERIPHADALELMKTASLLYLVQGWEAGVTEYVSVASKTYEYLATGLPVLADVPPGDNADIIRRYATRAWVVTSPTVDAMKAAVQQACAEAGTSEPQVSPDFVETFSRQRLTGALSDVLDRVVSPSGVRTNRKAADLDLVPQQVRVDARD